MFLVFFCNYLNHHQVFIADALYELLGDDFCFVVTQPRSTVELKGGIDYSDRPYCLLATESNLAKSEALKLARVADVCIFGACSQKYAVVRAKSSPEKLSFEYAERWLKKGLINVFSPVFFRWWVNYICYYRRSNFFKLCSSAFAANDDVWLGCYKNRHFKWGYFIEIPMTYPVNNLKNSSTTKIMWCACFIDWKHPELAIKCAEMLKKHGCQFRLDMYGDGEIRECMELSVKRNRLNEFVKFHGNLPNEMIQQAMMESDIFLVTSDRQEGWGVVVNEAMANGCCLVCSDKVGAAPFLIDNYKNGLLFKSKSVEDLFEKVFYLIGHPDSRKRMSERGYMSMSKLWSPNVAAARLLRLINSLQGNKSIPFSGGPCSKV